MSEENRPGQKVLVVDDELDSVRPLIRMLQLEGFNPHYEGDSVGALEWLSSWTPKLIILDLILGMEDGFELFQRIREMPWCATVPILFLSGRGEVSDRVKGLHLGAADFILKPYDLEEATARIKLQIRLREHEELLETRNRELAKAYEDLSTAQARAIQAEKLATIGQLSAGIAHEMSTPLGFIISNLKTLTEYLRDLGRVFDAANDLALVCANGEVSESLREKASAIVSLYHELDVNTMRKDVRDICRDCLEGSEAIARIATDLREFSRDEYEDLVAADIGHMIDRALNLARNELGERIKVERAYGETQPLACIPSRITQLFLILLVNAAQAIEGEGSISIRTRQLDEGIEAVVADTGCGIREEDMNRIFEPFYTSKAPDKGTGLGLSIAQKIVSFHHGTISVKSARGGGTQFTVTLPMQQIGQKKG